MKTLENAINYYDRFARVYDLISSKAYYGKAREYAIEQLNLTEGQTVLNVPCGTGQNLEYFQRTLRNTGKIIGVDLSSGMLAQAKAKSTANQWTNIQFFNADVRTLDANWAQENIESGVDAVLCDLGLSGFPDWEQVIDNLISLLKPDGRIVIMDWYMEKLTPRGRFIKWIGKGEVTRPLWQYLQPRVKDFHLNHTFNRNDVFVTSGKKIS